MLQNSLSQIQIPARRGQPDPVFYSSYVLDLGIQSFAGISVSVTCCGINNWVLWRIGISFKLKQIQKWTKKKKYDWIKPSGLFFFKHTERKILHEQTHLDLSFKYITCITDRFICICQKARERKYPEPVYINILGKTNRKRKVFFFFSKYFQESFKIWVYCCYDFETVLLPGWPMFFPKRVLSPCEAANTISRRFLSKRVCLRAGICLGCKTDQCQVRYQGLISWLSMTRNKAFSSWKRASTLCSQIKLHPPAN